MHLLVAVVISTSFIVLMILCRPNGVRSLGRLLLLVAVATLPWGAVQIAGVPIGDVVLILSLPPLVLTARRSVFALPRSVIVGSTLVAVAGIAVAIRPPNSGYIAGRFVPLSYAETIGAISRSTDNLSSLAKFEISLIVLPAVMVLACSHGPQFGRKIAIAWVAGIVLNSAVAFSDYMGVTTVSANVVGYATDAARQSGLSQQPNFIGVQAAMAVPILLVELTSVRGWRRLLFVAGLMLCALGVFVSGSRGSVVGAVLAIPVALVVSPQAREWTGRLLALIVIGCAYLLVSPTGSKILGVLRLTDTDAVSQSNVLRAAVRQQGLNDFVFSPLYGIGWDHSFEAHVIYIELLAAGGLLTALGIGIYIVGVVREAWLRVRPVMTVASALIASVFTWLVIGLVENQLTDQWIYVPLATLVGVVASVRGSTVESLDVSADHRAGVSRLG